MSLKYAAEDREGFEILSIQLAETVLLDYYGNCSELIF
jgi:hypothetical protein